MNLKGTILLILLQLSIYSAMLAMPADSTINTENFPDHWNIAKTDTSIFDFHNYHPANYFGIPGTGTGNIGSSRLKLEPDAISLSRKEFSLANGYDHVLEKADVLEKFSSSSRFTRLYYQIGSGKQQNLKVNHTQYITPRIQVALSFDRFSSEGKYPRQLNRVGDLGTGLRGSSKNETYRFFANYRLQHLENQENGGAQPEAAPLGDPQLQSVFLSSANNDLRNYSLFFMHELNLGTDSGIDSTQKIHPIRMYARHEYNRGRTLYSDDQPLSGYYQFTWLDTTMTRDVYRHHDFKNEAGIDYSFRLNASAYKAGIAIFSRSDKHIFEGADTMFNDLGWKINASTITKGQFNFGIDAYGVASGQAAGDRHTKLNAGFILDDKFNVDLMIEEFDLQTNLFLNKYASNHFIWSAALPAIKAQNLKMGIKYIPLNLESKLEFKSIVNYPFLNEALFPRSFSGTTNITSVELSKLAEAGKWIFRSRIRLNDVSDNTAIDLPQYVFFQRFQYNNYLFKNALGFSAGIDVSYIPAFFADAWMPALRSYYRQSKQKTGDHIFINPFVNLKISNARIFVMLEDAAGDMINGDAMIVPRYPLQGRSLRFGINWDFFD